MTKAEVLKCLTIIKVTFPNWARDFNAEERALMAEVWLDCFKDFDGAIVLKALKSVLIDSRFAPTIAEVMDKIRIISGGTDNDHGALAAWDRVRRAIKNGLYKSQEEYLLLPREIQLTLGSHLALKEWACMKTEDVETVIQSNFLRNYGITMAREEELRRLPSEVRSAIDGTFKLEG